MSKRVFTIFMVMLCGVEFYTFTAAYAVPAKTDGACCRSLDELQNSLDRKLMILSARGTTEPTRAMRLRLEFDAIVKRRQQLSRSKIRPLTAAQVSELTARFVALSKQVDRMEPQRTLASRWFGWF